MSITRSFRPRFRFGRVVLPAALLVLASGCSTGDDGSSTPAVEEESANVAEEEDAGSSVEDDAVGGELPMAGDLLEAVPRADSGVDAWDVEYLTTGVEGALVAVTGVVIAPRGVAPGADVVSWAHGTVGVADTCAPSRQPGLVSEAPQRFVDAGYVVAVTDYEGLGGEGTHPYLVGTSEARSVIDIVRAARQLDLGVSDRYAVAGLSQGGHAALWSGQLAGDYGSELDLVGVVAAAPAANIDDLMQTIGTAAQGFAVMAAYAYGQAYDDVSLADYFTPEAIELMSVVETGCNADVFAAFGDVDYETMVVPAAWSGTTPLGPLADRLAENEVARSDIAVPVLLVQGDADAIVARERVEEVQDRYCDLDTNARYSLYLGGGHVDTIITAMDDVLAWVDDRFSGEVVEDGCTMVDPDLETLRLAEETEAAVEGVLMEGVTPDGYDTLVDESSAPRLETCPGTPIFGGVTPVAYSSSVWLVEPGVGPFLDAFVARFESPDQASAALRSFDRELIDCGAFVDPATTAAGSFSPATDPALGEESFGVTFSGALGGIPVNRLGYTVRVGDTVYSASQSIAFETADPAIVLEAIQSILPQP